VEFVGAPIGIMDQMAASLGREGEALFIDTRSLAVERVPMPTAIEVVVLDSGISHAHAGGEYAVRRRESFDAAALLGIERLRDASPASLRRIDALPPLLCRRARHIVRENQRVLDAVEALRSGDTARLGTLFAESHASQRDDYDTSTPEIDRLVTLAAEHPDVLGARLTGGGFGGAVVALARAGRGRTAARVIQDAYGRQTGKRATVLVPPETRPN
jgi:galactokinase